MRLKKEEIKAIQEAFDRVYESGELILFGSRLDDKAKGGDVDLFIRSSQRKKLDFLVELSKRIDYYRFDVVESTDENRLIEKEAKRGVILFQKG